MKGFIIYTYYNNKKRFFIKTKEFRLPRKGEFITYPDNLKIGVVPVMFDFTKLECSIYKEITIKRKRVLN